MEQPKTWGRFNPELQVRVPRPHHQSSKHRLEAYSYSIREQITRPPYLLERKILNTSYPYIYEIKDERGFLLIRIDEANNRTPAQLALGASNGEFLHDTLLFRIGNVLSSPIRDGSSSEVWIARSSEQQTVPIHQRDPIRTNLSPPVFPL